MIFTSITINVDKPAFLFLSIASSILCIVLFVILLIIIVIYFLLNLEDCKFPFKLEFDLTKSEIKKIYKRLKYKNDYINNEFQSDSKKK